MGVSITFIGGELLTVCGLGYIGAIKSLDAQAKLRSAMAGEMLLADFVRLSGLLNHFVVLLAMPYHVMYAVYDILDETRKQGRGLDEPIVVTPRGHEVLQQFLTSLLQTAGVSALAAIFPDRAPAAAQRLYVLHSSDLGHGEAGNLR